MTNSLAGIEPRMPESARGARTRQNGDKVADARERLERVDSLDLLPRTVRRRALGAMRLRAFAATAAVSSGFSFVPGA